MPTRDTFNIFDLIFKKLLRISRKAVICLINAQFHTGYPLDSPVEYLNTEHISEHLGHLFSDSVIMIRRPLKRPVKPLPYKTRPQALIDRKHLYHLKRKFRITPI
jgi:hypothetical protein